jgi:phosphopantothenoylcysteine decarboxylase/phosphopantothenate--cysteine ligase
VTGLGGRHVLLGVSGGIAAYKAAVLARALRVAGADVTTVLTGSATRFVGADTFAGLTGRPAHTSVWERPGTMLHIELARDADVFVIAPATANTIAKLAHGLADDLLSATALEYEGPLVLAPAMHAGMWEAPATKANAATLADRGVRFVGPVAGALARGDEGMGRMSEPEDIVRAVDAIVTAPDDRALAGRRVLITAGPTHEPIDPVRFIGNRSSGKMGAALAAEALARGARVTVVLGPGAAPPPAGAETVAVETAEEMRAAVWSRRDADVIVMAAAIADFRPKRAADHKLKKEQGLLDLVLEPTPDILAELGGARPPRQVLVGFAAETDDLETAGRRKLERKGCDLVVANEVGRPGTGFGAATNVAAILGVDGEDIAARPWTKDALAAAIWDRVAELLEARPEP